MAFCGNRKRSKQRNRTQSSSSSSGKWQQFKRCNRWTSSASAIIVMDPFSCSDPGPGAHRVAAVNAWWSVVMWLWCHHPPRLQPSQSHPPPLLAGDVARQWSSQPPHKLRRLLQSPNNNNNNNKWSLWPQPKRPPSGRLPSCLPDTKYLSRNKAEIPGKSN